MQLNLGQAMGMAFGTMAVASNADANHDGKYSAAEITAACQQELTVGLQAYPDLAARLHSTPEKLAQASALMAEAIKVLTS